MSLFFYVAIYKRSKFITLGYTRRPEKKWETAGEWNPSDEQEGQLMVGAGS